MFKPNDVFPNDMTSGKTALVLLPVGASMENLLARTTSIKLAIESGDK